MKFYLTMLIVGTFNLLLVSGIYGDDKSDLKELRRKLSSPDYEVRRSVAVELSTIGEKRPLNKEEISLLLPCLKSDSDWRVKIMVALTLCHAENPDWVIQPLIDALQDRKETSSGNGQVPAYASEALVLIGDARALKPINKWLKYLETHPDSYPESNEQLIIITKRCIARLEKKISEKQTDDSINPLSGSGINSSLDRNQKEKREEKESLEDAFKKAEPWAISETAKKGRSIIPTMLEGLDNEDPQYRQACRKVLYSFWGQLNAKERKQAASGQLAVRLVQIKKDILYKELTMNFTLGITRNIPGVMKMYDREIGLVLDGRCITNFNIDIETELIDTGTSEVKITLRLPYNKETKNALVSSQDVQIVGRSWFGVNATMTKDQSGKIIHDPEFVPDKFPLYWITPPIRYTPHSDQSNGQEEGSESLPME